jgi:hypothetical protein
MTYEDEYRPTCHLTWINEKSITSSRVYSSVVYSVPLSEWRGWMIFSHPWGFGRWDEKINIMSWNRELTCVE